jgi:hypothetical protein
MPNTHITKNYAAHGGDEWVIGGKLTFLEGATVEGGEGLFDSENDNGFTPAAYQADSTASSYTALKEDFNALLAKLRASGLMEATMPAETPAPEETPVQGEGGGT